MSNSSSNSGCGCISIIILIVLVLLTYDMITDNRSDIKELKEQYKIHHIDSDDWAETANALDIHPDSMTMMQFKQHDTLHSRDAVFND